MKKIAASERKLQECMKNSFPSEEEINNFKIVFKLSKYHVSPPSIISKDVCYY